MTMMGDVSTGLYDGTLWQAWSVEMPAVIGLPAAKKSPAAFKRKTGSTGKRKKTSTGGRDDIKGAWRNLGGFRLGLVGGRGAA